VKTISCRRGTDNLARMQRRIWPLVVTTLDLAGIQGAAVASARRMSTWWSWFGWDLWSRPEG
jgi:hypothetical protein